MSNAKQVTVVTDSTADIPESITQELGIPVVPLRINFGQESFRDGIDLTTDQFIEKLKSAQVLPTTSQPTASEFAAAFQDAIDEDRDVVCVTIAARLSGTFQAATTAAEQVSPDRITVIDSCATTMQLGWPVIAGARIAAEGAERERVVTAVNEAISRANLFCVLKTLDYVYKGGRIGKASQIFGSALNIKPIISFRDGVVVPLERVRTWKKALRRIVQLVQDEGELSDIIVLYIDNREDADAILAEMQESHPDANVILGRAGAVISTHAGPGAVAIATLRKG